MQRMEADDIADAIDWMVTRPRHVAINEILVRPTEQPAERGARVTRLVVVADDLTGAADSAALLTRLGRTSVLLDADSEWPEDDVLAVDTDSRHRDPVLAAARAAEATRRARRLGAQVVKKVDSTLRGHVAAELRR